MTIKELYEWAKEKELENYPILINKGNIIENISGAEIVDKDNIFNDIFFKIDKKSIILK